MSPMKALELRLRNLREERLPTAGERTPVSPVAGRLSATTRRWLPLPRHLTPSQLQWLPPLLPLVLPFHVASTPPPWTAAALKARSAASSLACCEGAAS